MLKLSVNDGGQWDMLVPQKFLDVLQQPVHVLSAYDPVGALA
jgi:aminopeptidase C